MKEAEAAFRQDLEEIAHESGIRIVVLIPDLRGHGDKRTRQIAYAELKEELRLALSCHAWALEAPTEFIELPLGWSYQLLPAESTDENSVSPVGVGFSMAQGRTIRTQFTEFNLPTILTKLSSQLAPALGDFAHAGLILDQRYVEREEPPLTNPILTPATMKSVLDSERAVRHSNLDKVWLIGECDYIEEIWARSD